MTGSVLRFIGFSLFLGAVALIATGAWLLRDARAPGPLASSIQVVIPPGIGSMAIGDVLYKNGVIRSQTSYALALILKGYAGDLKAGEYEFSPQISVFNALDKIAHGDVYQRKLTIPEGLSSAEIIALVKTIDTLTGEIAALPQEGRLLPETYLFSRGDTRQGMINRMIAAMDQTMTPLWTARHPDFPLKSVNEVLTLASIIEKETGVPHERPTIASVFFNRLELGMKLQSDPTVIYALTAGKKPLGRLLTTRDLEATNSPYNTYFVTGLPPAPIANPGRASIMAVFAPAKTNYLYFVADGTGGHAFAATLAQHNRNVQMWRKLQSASLKTP
jgi:UPF0755 protein